MEAVPLSQLSDVLTQELGGAAGKGQVWVSVERGRCSLRICAQPFEWWLKAIIEAAKAWGEDVIDESNQDLQTADWLAQMTAKHVELNPIVAAFIGILNDTIGHNFSRSKAKTDPSTVPAYFPGPADAYAGRAQSMTLDQLVAVLQSIFDFIQAKQWGPQDIRDLRDALVAAAWHPLASSVGTWAGLNCCFEALAKRARVAGYGDRGEAGLKQPGPNPDWRAVGPNGPHKIWQKKNKSEQGSNGEVVPAGEELREEERRDEEGGSVKKRARGTSRARAVTAGGAGRKNGRQQGGRTQATVHLPRQSSGRAMRGGLPSRNAVPAYGGAGTHSTVAIGDGLRALEAADEEELDKLAGLDEFLVSVSSDLDNGAFDGLPMNGARTRLDLEGIENGGPGSGSQPGAGRGSPGRPGTGSDASNSIYGDSANDALASSGEVPPWGSGALHFPGSENPSPGRFGGEVAPPVYMPGATNRTIPVSDLGSMDMDGGLFAPAEGVGLYGARASPNQREEYWRAESPGNGGFPAPVLAGRPLYPTIYPGPATPPANVLLGRARHEATHQNFSPTHIVAAESETRFTNNLVSPGATSYAGHGVGLYAPGQTPLSPGALSPATSPHAVPYAGAPNLVRNQVHLSQATHHWPPHQGVPPRGDLYPPSAMPPAGGSPQWYHQPQPTPPAQHGGPQSLHPAGPGNEWRTLHAPQTGWPEPPVHSPGSGYASPVPAMHYDWGASRSPGGGSGGQPKVVHRGNVPPRAAAPTAASTSSKLGNLFSSLLRSNPKPLIPNPGVVSDRGFPPGGPTFHAAQPPQIHNGHSATGGLRSEQQGDPQGVHSAQFRRRNSIGRDPSARSPGVGGTYWAPLPPHLHPAPAKTALSRPERQNEPSEVRSAQFRQQVSLGRGPLARLRRNASLKRGPNPPPGREVEGEEELEAELAALVEILQLEDRATGDPCPRAGGIPLGRGRGSGAEGDNDEASDGAEGAEKSDDSDTDVSEWETDASSDESDGASGTRGPTVAGIAVKSEDTSSGLSDGAHAGAYGGAYVPRERPPVSRPEAPQAAPVTGARNVATGATTAPRRGNLPSSSALELLQSYQAEPKPEARLSSLRNYPAASVHKLQTTEVGELPVAMKSSSAAAAAGIPANGTTNGTTTLADLSGMHHGRWASAPGGPAPKRIYAERAH